MLCNNDDTTDIYVSSSSPLCYIFIDKIYANLERKFFATRDGKEIIFSYSSFGRFSVAVDDNIYLIHGAIFPPSS